MDLAMLLQWIVASAGAPIAMPSGKELSFARARIVGPAELDAVEVRLGKRLPAEYRELLERVGPSSLFACRAGAIEVYDPAELSANFSDYFEHPEQELRRVLPIACDTRLQELVVCFLDRDPAANVLVVPHDTPPEDWEDEGDAEELWTTFSEWLAEAITMEGEMKAH